MIFTAIKRFIERDRVVFVYRALTEGQGKFSGICSDETGWVVVRRQIGDTTQNVCDSTILENCVRILPVCCGSPVSVWMNLQLWW